MKPVVLVLVVMIIRYSFANCCRFNSATVDVSNITVEDTADFALKLFATIEEVRRRRKAGECFSNTLCPHLRSFDQRSPHKGPSLALGGVHSSSGSL